MMLDSIRLMFDAGVLVLIWLVQLVIYPSFRYLDREAMQRWHPKYTVLVSLVVMPLMLGQAALAIYYLYRQANVFSISTGLLIAIAWGLTFFYAVPLHNAIESREDHRPLTERLLFINGIRTLVWSLAFVLSLTYLLP